VLLRDRRAIVTGAAGASGSAAARAFAREGARVAALDVDDERGREVVAEIGPSATYLHCDVSRRAEVDDAFARAVAWLGGLDVLVHAGGIWRGGRPAEDLRDDEWDEMFAVVANATRHVNQAAFPYLRERGGRILNFGSGSGIRGQRGAAHYSAAKGAVMAWTRTIAQEWARYGITAHSIVPAVRSAMQQSHLAGLTREQREAHARAMQQAIPLGGDSGDADRDLAPVLVFLASDMSHFMTGQAIPVDGGMVMLG
jgi:NAD(P)-dependent dehydrogenase (short-subunit alcohol dehydrogenase family)